MNELNELKRDFKEKKQVVLFLGAGVNLSEGYYDLSWYQLMGEMLGGVLSSCAFRNSFSSEEIRLINRYAGKLNENDCSDFPFLKSREKFNSLFPPLVQATVIKQMMGSGYIPTIQQKLYTRGLREDLERAFTAAYQLGENNRKALPFFTLYCLARMILLCDNIKAVVTYNYDNLLSKVVSILLEKKESFFEKDDLKIVESRFGNFTIKDIAGMEDLRTLKNDVFPVYHVHGYIPDETEIIPKGGGGIVLSMDEIYESTRDVFSWQTSTQLHFLSNYVCILSGISFSDVTTQRMLYYVGKSGHKENIYYLDAFIPSDENSSYVEAEKAFMKIRNSFLREYGLTVIYEWKEGFNKLFQDITENSIYSFMSKPNNH